MTEKRTASFKVYFDVPRFKITYKNKRDLFAAFQKKLKELNLDINNITWADWDGGRSLVNTPDDLLGAAEEYSGGTYSLVKLFYRTNDFQKPAICSRSEEKEERQKENGNEEVVVKQCRSRSTSCDCRCPRSSSFDSPYGYPSPQSSYAINLLEDPRFPYVPFNADEQSYRPMSSIRPEKSCMSKDIKRKRRHCSCERLN